MQSDLGLLAHCAASKKASIAVAWDHMIIAVLLCFGIVMVVGPAMAQLEPVTQPPDDPFLVIDVGMHTANVTDIDVGGRGLIATSSLDKTVRLWDARTNQLIERIPVPRGYGPEGNLLTVAVSPDTRYVVAGGVTGLTWDNGKSSLYVLDRNDNVMRRRSKLPDLVNIARFSGQGDRLALGFPGGLGLGVMETQRFKFVGSDSDYGDASIVDMAYSPTGWLAVSADDGTVRLYDETVSLVASTQFESGTSHGIAFSPAGDTLAVGFRDDTRIELLNGQTLSKVRTLPKVPEPFGDTPIVTWAMINQSPAIIVSGRPNLKSGNTYIGIYSMEAKRWSKTERVGTDTVTALTSLPNGGAVFSSADPSWGRISPDGRLAFTREAGLPDFREVDRGIFGLSADGNRLAVGTAKGGKDGILIDLVGSEVVPISGIPDGLTQPNISPPNTQEADWRNLSEPKIGGRAIDLIPGDVARSLVVLPQGGFGIGSDREIRIHNATGQLRARSQIPASAYGLVVSDAGDVLVAVLADGTIRWYDIYAGGRLNERGAFFVHRDTMRWVVWTMAGFFVHSPGGGQDMVGYLLNKYDAKRDTISRSRQPVDVDFSQIYRLLHRPDLVWRFMRDPQDTQPALDAAMARLGNIRELLDASPLPTVALVAVCEPETGITRAFKRTAPGVDPIQNAAMGENCVVLDQATRAFQRAAAPASSAEAAQTEGQETNETETSSRVITLKEGQTEALLRFYVTDGGGGLGNVDIMRDGRNVGRTSLTRAFKRIEPVTVPGSAPGTGSANADQQQAEATGPGPIVLERVIDLREGMNALQVRAFNNQGIFGKAELTLIVPPAVARGEGPALEDGQEPVSRLHILAVGVNDYDGGDGNDLKYAVQDARDVSALITERATAFYDDIKPIKLFDADAHRSSLIKALQDIAEVAQPQDGLVIYMAGHGIANEDGLYEFITPEAYVGESPLPGLGQDVLAELVADIRAERKMVFLDTCHSGGFDVERIAGNLGNESGYLILAAAASREEALDSYRDSGNGVFAHAVLEGLEGEAAMGAKGNKKVQAMVLGTHVMETVPGLAAEIGHAQTARFKGGGFFDSFPLAKVAEEGEP